jgi:hypothetical protein
LDNNIIQGKVSEALANKISGIIDSLDFGWYWNEYTIGYQKNEKEIGGLSHVFYKPDVSINSSYFPLISYLLEELKEVINVEFIVRAQANLICNINVSEEENINSLHTDSPDDNTFSILYYVITSDGNTVIYNKEGSNIKVSPIKGNYVIFPSNLLHKASPPKDNKKRMVINIIVKGKLKE